MKKKWISVVVSLAMVASMSCSVFAEEAEEPVETVEAAAEEEAAEETEEAAEEAAEETEEAEAPEEEVAEAEEAEVAAEPAAEAAPAEEEVVLNGTPINVEPKYKDVVYATVPTSSGEDMELKMNIYQSENAGDNSPVLIYIHGGAWWEGSYECTGLMTGTDANENFYSLFGLVDEGVTLATVGYRLSQEAAYPAQINDCKGAVRYLRAHAEEYNINPDLIACSGESAGAHLALLLATTGGVEELEGDTGGNLEYSSSVQACVDFFGMTDIINLSSDLYDTPYNINAEEAYYQVDAFDSARSQLIGFNEEGEGVGVLRAEQNNPDTEYKEELNLIALASPIKFVTTDDAPVFMGQGGKDPRVAVAQANRLHQLFIQAGVESYLMVNSQAGHGNLGKYINEAAVSFLRDKLELNQ